MARRRSSGRSRCSTAPRRAARSSTGSRAQNRVVVTATRSGDEQNFARFGQYLAEAIADPRADLDKDGQVSLLEAFLTASSRVDEYYRTRSQLATEHALLDDNGDRLGTPADWFRGVRATEARQGRRRARRPPRPPAPPHPQRPRAAHARPSRASAATSSNVRRPPCGRRRASSPRTNTTPSSKPSWSSWPGSTARQPHPDRP